MGGIIMINNVNPLFSSIELQSQAMNFANHLSALFSIPLIEILHDSDCSIDQLQLIRSVFDILVSGRLYTDTFKLFHCMLQNMANENPVSLYVLYHFPFLIPYFLFEFLEEFDSLLKESE